MKIAMIGTKRMPSRDGGIDVVVGKLSSGLARRGEEVTVFVRKRKGTRSLPEYNGCRIKEVFTIDRKATDALVSSFFATILGLLGSYDVLHFHALGNTLFLFLRWLGRRKRIVVTIHGIDWKRSKFSGLGAKILKLSEKMAVKHADEIITLCENDHDYYLDAYGIETTVIPNGFEKHPVIGPRIITEKYGLHNEDYILFLARIVPEKGLSYLIEAYNQIDISQKLVIAGGSSHSTEYYAQMQKLAENNPKVIFTGFVQGQELEELYSNAYLFVLPSDIEGMPMSLLEALGHRRVCLVSDIRENRVDPVNSYFFEKGSVASLKEQLLRISTERKPFEDRSALMDWDTVVEETMRVYKSFSPWGNIGAKEG